MINGAKTMSDPNLTLRLPSSATFPWLLPEDMRGPSPADKGLRLCFCLCTTSREYPDKMLSLPKSHCTATSQLLAICSHRCCCL